MTTTTSPAGARTNAPAPAPTGRLRRVAARLAPHSTLVRVAGGVLTIVGTYLPWTIGFFPTNHSASLSVLATVCAANVRDYAVVVIEDCVNTMDSPAHHDAALMCIRTAFGFVTTSAEALELVRSWTTTAA